MPYQTTGEKTNVAVSKYQLFRILKQHYIEDMTQREIAVSEGLSTATVSRLIKEAKEAGYVKITLDLPDNSVPELEMAVKERFGVSYVSVIHVGLDNPDLIVRDVTKVFADYLNSIMHDGDVIGLSWGRTLSRVAHNLEVTEKRDVTFVSMSGGVSMDVSDIGVEQIVRDFANVYGAQGFSFPLPVYLEDRKLAEALMSDRQFKGLFHMIERANIAIFSVGPISTNSLLYHSGYFTYQGIRELEKDGFVGDIGSRLYRFDGTYNEDDYYNRSVGITLEELRKKEHKLCIVLEQDKAAALAGALRGNYIDALFIDELTARALLEIEKEKNKT